MSPTEKRSEVLTRATDRVLGHKAELQELACVLYSMLWGAIILFYTFKGTARLSGVVFEKMEMFAPGRTWGYVFFFFGLVGLIGYILKIKNLRRFGSMFGVIGWTILSYLMLVDFTPAFGIIPVVLSAVFSMLSFIRLGFLDE